MTDESIKAGDIWGYKGQTIEWLQDMHIGDPVSVHDLLIDGVKPESDDPFPSWAYEDPGPQTKIPPSWVTVTRAEASEQ